MFDNLNHSYPFNNNFKHNLKTIGLVSMAFVLIVLYFQPFGINFLKSEHDGYFVLAAGIMSALTLFGNSVLLPGLLPFVFKTERWTIRKEIIWNIWLFSNLFLIFFFLVFYVRQISFTDLPVFRTGALALLPLILFNFINYNRSLKDKVVSVIDSGKLWFKEEKLHHEQAVVSILAENGKDIFRMDKEDVILFHSSGNYIEIFFKHKDVYRKKLFRQTLGNVEERLKELPDFKKCHRCWIINMKKIKSITGNSTGYFLLIDGFDLKIPVSRNYISFFRESFS
jgi:hypothetical protein